MTRNQTLNCDFCGPRLTRSGMRGVFCTECFPHTLVSEMKARIMILWTGMNSFYNGTVVDTFHCEGEYLQQVQFDDGDIFCYNLDEVCYIFMDYGLLQDEFERRDTPLPYPFTRIPASVSKTIAEKVLFKKGFNHCSSASSFALLDWFKEANTGTFLDSVYDKYAFKIGAEAVRMHNNDESNDEEEDIEIESFEVESDGPDEGEVDVVTVESFGAALEIVLRYARDESSDPYELGPNP